MRPLRLEVEGFTVYRRKQVIDFEGLNFFIIQGKTGAGKTSIVDAITYALYGRVPRYGSTKAHRFVISRGSARLSVALDFSVTGRRYRIERFYRPKPEESMARAYEEGRRLNLSSSQMDRWVEEITGLDYRTFTRVILLPQGEFDRFLKPSSPRERREILIGLLDLEIFEKIRQMASESYRELEGELVALRGEYSELEGVTEESLEELRKRAEKLRERLEGLKAEIAREKELLKKAEERDRIAGELGALEAELGELREREAELGELEERVGIAKRILPFVPYMQQLEETERELRSLRLGREKILRDSLRLKGELENVEGEAETVEREYARIPDLRRELQRISVEMERLRRAGEELSTLEELKREVAKKERLLSRRKAVLEECEERLRRGEEIIRETEERLGALGYSEEEYLRAVRESERYSSLREKERRLEEVNRDIAELERRRADLRKRVTALRERLSDAEEELRKQSLTLYACRIREALKEGDSCPVCGGVYREGKTSPPQPAPVEELDQEISGLREEIVSLERELSDVEVRIETLSGEAELLRSRLEAEKELLATDPAERLRELEEKRKEKADLEERLRKYRERFTRLLRERESAFGDVEGLRAEIGALERSLREKERLLKELVGDPTAVEDSLRELEVRREDIEAHIGEVEERRERIRSYREELLRQMTALSAKLSEVEESIGRLESRRKESLRKLTPLFEELGDYERIRSASMDEEEIRNAEEKISAFRRKRELLEGRIRDLRERLSAYEDLPPSADVAQKLSGKEREMEELLRELGETEAERKQTEELLRRKGKIGERITELERKLSVYGKLREDLKSDRLQDFVSALMLKRIVERGSDYLLSFTGSYEFEIGVKGDLVVVDRVQGMERDVKSLSGGETFLASLSLALGVSDVLSASARLESLFIDEGFGSLDEETRERVSDILELVKQRINRMVGIISHIPDLAERFHQRIVVRKHGDFSTVEVFR